MIVSTTLVGPGQEEAAREALKSVESIADKRIVIRAPNSDPVFYNNTKAFWFKWTGSFADARNFALECAAKVGATWALTLDADERLISTAEAPPNPKLIDPYLQSADVLLCFDDARSYAKERFIKLPAAGKWVGPVHECYVGGRREIFGRWRVRELPKTPEQLKDKFGRDRMALLNYIGKHSEDARWYFYLGETYKNLGENEEALGAFAEAQHYSKWDEEKAWAIYRMAEIVSIGNQYNRAIGLCCEALHAHPGFAEAAWLAGWCSYQLDRNRDAIYWSRIAQAIAEAEREPALARIGFRFAPAYGDWPNGVEEFARKRMEGKT
jgi:tetratricopeptide (TPR) repeat protein